MRNLQAIMCLKHQLATAVFTLLVSHFVLEAAWIATFFVRNPFQQWLPNLMGAVAVFAVHQALVLPLNVLNAYPITSSACANALHIRKRLTHFGFLWLAHLNVAFAVCSLLRHAPACSSLCYALRTRFFRLATMCYAF
jgi:hypothetical protein